MQADAPAESNAYLVHEEEVVARSEAFLPQSCTSCTAVPGSRVRPEGRFRGDREIQGILSLHGSDYPGQHAPE